jgi:flagellar motor switch/type III secretory pathway protein FliN
VNVQRFELETCPRVPAWQARGTRAALRACALVPESWIVELTPLGSARMIFAGYDSDRDPADVVELAVSFGVDRGTCGIEAAFAARLVDAVLGGGGVFPTARSVGPAERGVLAGVIAPVFDHIGGGVQLERVPRPRARRQRGLPAIALRLETVVASGWLRLTLPPAAALCARAGRADVWRVRAGRVPVVGLIEIAVTDVPAGALARVAVGDAIVFDGQRSTAFSGAGPWNGRLRVGDHAADVAVDAAGMVSVVGGFSTVINQEGTMSASGSKTDATTVLAAASIEVVAELGRLTLRGDELLGLAPGAVLALGARRTSISLRVGGEVWADGEIVDIDGDLGVRVTRLVNR